MVLNVAIALATATFEYVTAAQTLTPSTTQGMFVIQNVQNVILHVCQFLYHSYI